jgi:hypothetical protein
LSSDGVYWGGNESYFQEFPLLVTQEKKAELTLLDDPLGTIPFVEGADFTMITHSGSNMVTAPVLLVGNGYVRPDKDRDDYAGMDAKGKIVVILRGYPESPWDFGEDFPRGHTLRWAKDRGAVGVLFYQGSRIINGAAIPAESYDPTFPMMYVSDRVLNLLFDDTGYTLKTYQDKIKNGPLPLETHKRIRMHTVVHKLKTQTANNVLGLIHGTDPVLTNEIIVIGAHLDHLGVNSHGVVYNGANDNGSGTVVVSELARTFAQHPPKRSILIAHFGAEEEGLLGSDYFAQHPTIPIGNVVCMLNFDMSGHGGKRVVMGGGDALGAAWNEYVATLDSAAHQKTAFGREDGHGASDNLSFLKAGVPAVAFWSEGDHIYYHHYSDDPKWISTDVLNMMGSRGEDFLRFLGNYVGPLAYHADSLALLASFADVIDFKGTTLDAQGIVPDVKIPSAAWVASDHLISTAEVMRRTCEFRFACQNRKVTAGSMKDAIDADRSQKRAIFLGISESALSTRRPAEVGMLLREGVKLIKLTHANGASERSAPEDVLSEARDGGALALVPLDYNTPVRVETWKKQAIVVGSLQDFAASPPAVREGLLKSDAMLIFEVTSVPTKEQLDTIYPARWRRVHLNAGTAPISSRLAEQKATYRAMYAEGMKRDEILALIGGNLRRYLEL